TPRVDLDCAPILICEIKVDFAAGPRDADMHIQLWSIEPRAPLGKRRWSSPRRAGSFRQRVAVLPGGPRGSASIAYRGGRFDRTSGNARPAIRPTCRA